MTTTAYTGLTGSGYIGFTGTGTTLVIRLNVTQTGPAGSLFPFGTPQRYGGIGWVSPYEELPANFDGSGNPAGNYIVNPVTWIDTLMCDLDLTPINTDVQGLSGLAYALNTGVSIDVYATEF